jgi:hypothetical protein
MAEENSNQPEAKAGGEENKQTNRTFTQSEYDKAIADHEKAVTEKFKDYETLKQKADAFEKEKADAEALKLSEVEKATKRAEDAEAKANTLEKEKTDLFKQTLKLTVLSDPKYHILPDPYKKLIDGDTIEAIKESAEKVGTEFAEYLKTLGVQTGNAGLPPNLHKNNNIPDVPKNAVQLALEKRFGKKGA